MMTTILMRVVVLAAAVALAGCGGESGEGPRQAGAGAGSGQIAVDGSSTVYPLTEAAAEAFGQTQTGAARITVGESGTGGGFRKFCRGETQISNASRPISSDEMAACAAAGVRYVEIPMAFDGVSIVVHQSNPITNITMAQLRQIWEPAAGQTIVRWNQIDRTWPDLPFVLFGPGTASGTFDYFTEAVMGAARASRTDFTPSEDDNVIVQGVIGNPGSMGYLGYAYYEQNSTRLRALNVDGVAPTPQTIAAGQYPLSRPVFVYVNAEALRRPQVRRFVEYYLNNVTELAPRVGYVPLPGDAYETYLTRVRDGLTGTAFGGHNEVGISISELVQRPLSDAQGQ